MPEYDNTNRGVLFVNDKDGNDKRPDYTGKVNVDGRELRLAAWKQEAQSGTKYLSIRVSEFEQRSEDNGSSSDSDSSGEQSGFDW